MQNAELLQKITKEILKTIGAKNPNALQKFPKKLTNDLLKEIQTNYQRKSPRNDPWNFRINFKKNLQKVFSPLKLPNVLKKTY